MHTPEQAKDLWCPMVRISRREPLFPGSESMFDVTIVAGCNTDALGGNRVPSSCKCIVDRCAMWRWVPMTESVPTTTLGASSEYARTFGVQTVRTHGYCGLAPLHSVPAS